MTNPTQTISTGSILVDGLTKIFGEGANEVTALAGVDFSVESGAFVSIVGPSGCGKSTLLNILAGIDRPTSGELHIGGLEQDDSRIGYVFQSPRLLPWRSVLENLVLVHGDKSAATEDICRQVLADVGLAGVEEKFPGQLSGGMQQRVGIARAFSVEPEVLFMDEPFSHLDAITASNLRILLSDLWKQSGKTVMFVTHDVSEAVELSTRILFLEQGGRLGGDMQIDLPFPRDAADDEVAMKKAEVLRRFKELQR